MRPGALILNQAADAIVHYLRLERPLGDGATRQMAEAGLRGVVDQYEGTRVSHIFWNVCYQRTAYRSDAWASYWDVDDPDGQTTEWSRMYYQLQQLGIDDVFCLLTERCRERGISPWISLRMNDVHYYENPHRMNPFWNENPQFRVHQEPGFDNGLDFTRPEVQAHYMKLVREVLSRWEADGLELDWMRFPNLFRPGDGERGREALTAFMHQVRNEADRVSERLGRRIRIATRVPATPEFSWGLGMDVGRWTREGLVDMLIPCSLWRPSFPDVPVEEWRQCTGNDCLIAAGTDLWTGGRPDGPVGATGMAPMRGFTASMLDRGADAIYLFNHFEPTDTPLARFTIEEGPDAGCTMGDLLDMAGDATKAAVGARRHILTFHDPLPPGSGYRPPLPARVALGQPQGFRLHVGPAPTTGVAVVRVGLGEEVGMADAVLRIQVNGVVCRPICDLPRPKGVAKTDHGGRFQLAEMAPRMIQQEAPVSALGRGYNRIEVVLSDGPPQRIDWLELYVAPE